MGNSPYAVVGGAAYSVLGSRRQISDVDFVVPQGNTRVARALLKAVDGSFEVERRTNHTYFKSSPPVEIEILTPPALFKHSFTSETPVLLIDQIAVLKPTLLLAAKCDSILTRPNDSKKDADAVDIVFLLEWCTMNRISPTAEEVPQATKEFVDYFVATHENADAWESAGWDFGRGCWSSAEKTD